MLRPIQEAPLGLIPRGREVRIPGRGDKFSDVRHWWIRQASRARSATRGRTYPHPCAHGGSDSKKVMCSRRRLDPGSSAASRAPRRLADELECTCASGADVMRITQQLCREKPAARKTTPALDDFRARGRSAASPFEIASERCAAEKRDDASAGGTARREREVLAMRYGIVGGFAPRTRRRSARALTSRRERVRQIENRRSRSWQTLPDALEPARGVLTD